MAFALICVIVIEILWKAYKSDSVQTMKSYIDQSADNPYSSKKMNGFFAMFVFFVLCMAVSAAIYFSERESYMLRQHGIAVSDRISGDLLHLQIQFLAATLSLNLISVIFLVLTYKYMSYKEYIGELDELTGIMGRRMFLFYSEKAQKAVGADAGRTGWFLFVDADYFKSINDTFGHAAGDKVLRTIAGNLQSALGDAGAVGRIGGDEFAAIIEKPLSRQELEQRLDGFLQAISGALPGRKVSCSIGAYQFTFPQNVTHLLSETDNVLYKAKENGRACYVLEPCTPDTP